MVDSYCTVDRVDGRVVEEWGRPDPVGHALNVCLVDPSDNPVDQRSRWTEGIQTVHAVGRIHHVAMHSGYVQFDSGHQRLLVEAIEAARIVEADVWSQHFTHVASLFEAHFSGTNEGDISTVSQRVRDIQLDFFVLEDRDPLEAHLRRYVAPRLDDFYRPARDEEEAANILLQIAREHLNRPGCDFGFVRELLVESIQRSRADGTGRSAKLAASLQTQIPFFEPPPMG